MKRELNHSICQWLTTDLASRGRRCDKLHQNTFWKFPFKFLFSISGFFSSCYCISNNIKIFLAVLTLQCPTQTSLPPQKYSILINYCLAISFPLHLVIKFYFLSVGYSRPRFLKSSYIFRVGWNGSPKSSHH